MRGRFGDTSGRPYVEGRLILPRLGITGDVSFCVDTGADRTVLMPTDGQVMRIDYSQLEEDPHPSVGMGGVTFNCIEPALVIFTEPGRFLYAYHIDLVIDPPDPDIVDLPSLLGREILNRWRMTYDPPRNRLTFEVDSADIRVPINP